MRHYIPGILIVKFKNIADHPGFTFLKLSFFMSFLYHGHNLFFCSIFLFLFMPGMKKVEKASTSGLTVTFHFFLLILFSGIPARYLPKPILKDTTGAD
jgi:hypothetical protein